MKSNNIYIRTEEFAVLTVSFLQKVPKTIITLPIIRQLVRSSTSVGANVSEAKNAHTKKEFIQKMTIALKEADETAYWFRILKKSNVLIQYEQDLDILSKENGEIIAMLIKIVKSSKESENRN